jgi:hypothetical protein
MGFQESLTKMYETRRLEDASHSGMGWIINSINPVTGWVTESPDLQALYKTPLALLINGFPVAAAETLGFVEKLYYDGAGHFKEAFQNLPYLTHCYFYRDAWLARAAMLLRHSSSNSITRNILGLQAESGGFYCSPAKGSKQGLLSTAVGGLIALYTHDFENASAAAQFIVDTFYLQPHPEQIFYLERQSSGELVIDIPQEHQNWVVFMPSQERPLLYAFGLCTAFLALASKALHQQNYLLGAEAFYTYYMQTSGLKGIQHPYSGKMAWAASLLYQLTGKSYYADTALAIADSLIERQNADGSWSLIEFMAPGSASPLPVTADRTAEFVVWLTIISRSLKFA